MCVLRKSVIVLKWLLIINLAGLTNLSSSSCVKATAYSSARCETQAALQTQRQARKIFSKQAVVL